MQLEEAYWGLHRRSLGVLEGLLWRERGDEGRERETRKRGKQIKEKAAEKKEGKKRGTDKYK